MIHQNLALKYRPDIDGLRAVAVLGVLFFHAFPKLVPGGFVGVDIFFVISGYLISGIILEQLKSNSFSIKDFYARRIRRIFPALLIVVMTTSIVGWWMLLPYEFEQLGKHILGAMGFISNFILWRESGYFDTSVNYKQLLHLWSLGIEEQFYLIWPFILCLTYRKKFKTLHIVMTLMLLSFFLNFLFIESRPTFVFYSPFTRFWELLIGAALAHKNQNSFLTSLSLYTKNLLPTAGTALLLISFFYIDEEKSFPGTWAILPVLGVALIVLSGSEGWINKKILASPVLVKIGLISYPLYLWHWPMLSYLNVIDDKNPNTVSRILILLISTLLSFLTYYLVEKKSRQKTNAFAWKLLASSFFILIFGLLVWKQAIQSNASRHPKLVEYSRAISDWSYPGSFKPFEYDEGKLFMKGSNNKKTLFIGDSRMEQFLPRIEKIINESPNSTLMAVFSTGEGCPPFPNANKDSFLHCNSFIRRSLSYAKREDVDKVVITGAWQFHIDNKKTFVMDKQKKLYLSNNPSAVKLAFGELETFIQELINLGKTVYLISDIPDGDEFNPKYQILRNLHGIQIKPSEPIDRNLLAKKYQTATNHLAEISKKTSAPLIDPFEIICSPSSCSPNINFIPKYKDSGHLRASFVEDNFSILDQTIRN